MKNISRREFGRASLGTLGGLALASSSTLGGEHAASSVFGGVQIGLMTYSFRDRPLVKAFEDIVKIGFSSVEMYSGHLNPFNSGDRVILGYKRMFAGAGVKIASYYVEMGDNPTDEQIFRCFFVARLLGTDILSSSLTKPQVPRVDKLCQKFKMTLGLHNHWFNPPDANQFQGPQDFIEVLKNSSERINITLDVGHFYAAGHDPVKFIKEHYERIVSLHLKDRGKDSQHINHPIGQGSTPLIAVVQALKKLHFQHAANIEWEVENADPVKGVADGLEYFKKALA